MFIYGHLIKQLITDKLFMLERICLLFWNGQLTLFLINVILKLNTYWKFCQQNINNFKGIVENVT